MGIGFGAPVVEVGFGGMGMGIGMAPMMSAMPVVQPIMQPVMVQQGGGLQILRAIYARTGFRHEFMDVTAFLQQRVVRGPVEDHLDLNDVVRFALL